MFTLNLVPAARRGLTFISYNPQNNSQTQKVLALFSR